MRISDWSSDVCSSDLASKVFGLRDRRPIYRLGEPLQYKHLQAKPRVVVNLLSGTSVSGVVMSTRRSEERREGKSVSVRVDLGGRRLIKKKKKTNISMIRDNKLMKYQSSK